MADFLIGERIFASGDAALQRTLAEIYASKDRPLCMCRQPGVPMCLARVAQQYVIKRMPDTGLSHAPGCESYEPPAELSGLGELLGHAIIQDHEHGTTLLKLDFSLSKSSGRAAPAASEVPADSVKSDGAKLTLLSVLHFLWVEAGLNRWTPKMLDRRNWFVIYKFLLEAAQGKVIKGQALQSILYVPEPFYPDRKDHIAQKRSSHLGTLRPQEKGARKLMIMVAEVKELCPARYGFKLVVKQAPDFPLMLDQNVYQRLNRRFEDELALWEATEGSHLMTIATFSVGTSGVASIEEIALMITTENWITFADLQEKLLINVLTEQSRRFVKGMRYNLSTTRPLASLVLTDTQPTPTAMYIVPAGANDQFEHAVQELAQASSYANWIWNASTQAMPTIPSSIQSAR